MKRITFYRTGEYHVLSGKLMKKSACKLFAEAKFLKKELGDSSLIITSHCPEAVNSAKTIKLVYENARILENHFLSRYYGGQSERIKADIVKYIRYFCTHSEHIILVSHSVIIDALFNRHIRQGECLVLEAEEWKDIFNLSACRISTMPDLLSEEAEDRGELLISRLSPHELEQVTSLGFLAD